MNLIVNPFTYAEEAIRRVLTPLVEAIETLSNPLSIQLEIPKDPSFGEISTNAAMVMAKRLKMSPKLLAESIKAGLELDSTFTDILIAGPGFINLRLRPSAWLGELPTILSHAHQYGQSNIGEGQRVNVEFVSVNPTGPMHIGHARGAAFGDTLSRLLEKLGYQVTREYYFNDSGGQMDVLARSCFIRYQQALGLPVDEIPEGLYPGDYLIPVGAALAKAHGASLLDLAETEWMPIIRDAATQAMMLLIKHDLELLGIHHDIFTSEQRLHRDGIVTQAVKLLEDRGHLYRGILPKPKGHDDNDWEPREQTLFRSTDFGDDVDRALQKTDGSWTYFAADVGYSFDKITRGFDKLHLVLGADHAGYVKRMQALMSALNEHVPLSIHLCQLVSFIKDGAPMKMSKRAGNYITVKDVVELVGADSIRFMMLYRKQDMAMDFDIDLVKQQSRDNPVFYVQYAHARIMSVLRSAEETFPGMTVELAKTPLEAMEYLHHPAEIALIRHLAHYPRFLISAAESSEPHRVVYYLQETAAQFHALWNLGKEQTILRFIHPSNRPMTQARLALIMSVAYVLRSGLALCNVTPVEQMS